MADEDGEITKRNRDLYRYGHHTRIEQAEGRTEQVTHRPDFSLASPTTARFLPGIAIVLFAGLAVLPWRGT